MAVAPERSKPLHNFSLPYLKWGTQKFLRCTKIPTNTTTQSSSLHPPSQPTKPINTHSSKSLKSIESMRQKLILDLRADMHNLQVPIIEEQYVTHYDSPTATRPWNLRNRRAACKAPPPEPPPREEKASSRLRGVQCVEKKETVKFSVSLSKEEIVDDFVAMVGMRPSRRPKKRPKIVQRQLDSIFPGFWLAEITPDSYKVADIPESGKG